MKTKILILIFLLLLSCGNRKTTQSASEAISIEEPIMEESAGEGIDDGYSYELEESVDMPEFELEESSPPKPKSNLPKSAPKTESAPIHATEIEVIPQPSTSSPTTIVPKYEIGKLVYDIPNEMVKLNTYTVVARIQRNQIDVAIYDGMSVTVDTTIRVSETMKVELVDPTGSNFKIVSNSTTQYIEVDDYTEWNFYVTPLVRGVSELKIIVSIIKNGVPKEEVYSDSILVKTTTWIEIKMFLQLYWQWFLTVAIIPLLGYLRKKFTKKKNP